MGSSPSFLDPVVLPLVRGTTILDLGCGWGRWGGLLRTNYFEWGIESFPQVTGIDGDAACIEACRKLGVYQKLVCQLLPCDLPEKAYDTVIASEIVEHLTKDEVDTFLKSCEATAKYRVIITTPNFECLRGGSKGPLGFNQLDHHQCVVTQAELLQRGYTLVGAGFSARQYRPARALARLLKLLGFDEWKVISSLSYSFPKLAHTTVAFKEIAMYPKEIPNHYQL
jgi:2-polyprenyl-3-methyl-5-hydroxy-6-metoxy-1,4-benzoquinol methylase